MDIYTRVAELIKDKREKLSDREVFDSSAYKNFLNTKAKNIIMGSCYNLRRLGFVISQQKVGGGVALNRLQFFLRVLVWTTMGPSGPVS